MFKKLLAVLGVICVMFSLSSCKKNSDKKTEYQERFELKLESDIENESCYIRDFFLYDSKFSKPVEYAESVVADRYYEGQLIKMAVRLYFDPVAQENGDSPTVKIGICAVDDLDPTLEKYYIKDIKNCCQFYEPDFKALEEFDLTFKIPENDNGRGVERVYRMFFVCNGIVTNHIDFKPLLVSDEGERQSVVADNTFKKLHGWKENKITEV